MAKKQKNPPQIVVMDDERAKCIRKIASRWDFICVICGHEFVNVACITKEHIVPKSMLNAFSMMNSFKQSKENSNYAPTHYRCNQLRGVKSIFDTGKFIEQKRLMMRHDEFVAWLNVPVPNRIVPDSAHLPLRVPKCLMPPDTLPCISYYETMKHG